MSGFLKNAECVLIVLVVLFRHSGAGEDHRSSMLQQLGDDGLIFLRDAGSYCTAPVRFSGAGWLTTAGVGAGTLLLMTADAKVKELLGRETEKSMNGDFWDVPTTYGVVTYANLFSLSLYAGGLLTGADGVRTTGRMLFQSLTYSGVTVMALRYIFGRERPYGDNTPWQFGWFEGSNRSQSFPSGHTAVAFAMSTVLAEQIGGVWAGIGLYGLAALTGYARILNNQHWLSDVVTGAGLGVLTGLYVVNEERRRQAREPDPALEIGVSPFGISVTCWLR